ncbi:MAG: hypothetical protein R3A80_09300 [Bdellovibrionota bacterium]
MKKLILISFTLLGQLSLATETNSPVDIKTTFAELDKLKEVLKDISPRIKAFDQSLDDGSYKKLNPEEKALLDEAEVVRGVAISKAEKATKALNLADPKSPLLGDINVVTQLKDYFLFFQDFSGGIDLCNNVRPALEIYIKDLKIKNPKAKADQRILDCIKFEAEEGQH